MWRLCYLLTLSLCALFVFSSCTQDAYDKGEGTYSQMTAEMADGYTSAAKQVVRFTTDNEETFNVTTPFSSTLMPKADTVYRAVFYYNKQGNEAQVMGLSRVLVANPRSFDDLKTDPVKLESIWMARSRRYLNLSFYIMLGSTDSEAAQQKIGCQRDTLISHANGKTTLCLTIYHDQADVPQYYSQRTYLSIPMEAINPDTVIVTVNTYDGPIVKTLAR